MAHFYLADAVTDAALGDLLLLTGDEGRHAASVARLRVGERTRIGDGAGRIATAEATAVSKDAVELRVVELTVVPAPVPAITLVQALAKGDRGELAIQAATELGVAAVIPWAAERSVPRWTGEKAERGRSRWASIVREAGKQAMRPWAAAVLPLHTTDEVAALAAERMVVVLDPDAPERLMDVVPTDVTALAIVVGPEGGIAPAELAAFTAAGARTARLGSTVLRTSTAAPVALAALAVHVGSW